MDLIVYGWDLLKDFKQVVSMLIPVDFLIHIIVVLMVEDLYRIEVVHVMLFIGGIRVQMDGRIVVQRPIQIDVVFGNDMYFVELLLVLVLIQIEEIHLEKIL